MLDFAPAAQPRPEGTNPCRALRISAGPYGKATPPAFRAHMRRKASTACRRLVLRGMRDGGETQEIAMTKKRKGGKGRGC